MDAVRSLQTLARQPGPVTNPYRYQGTMHLSLLLSGIIALLAGGVMLVRPSAACLLLGLAKGERTTYALRMAGTMAGAFGLALIGFAIVVGRM